MTSTAAASRCSCFGCPPDRSLLCETIVPAEELKEALGLTSLYNESLGTVSDRYVYDRVTDRDQPEPQRPKRPWQAVEPATTGKRRA